MPAYKWVGFDKEGKRKQGRQEGRSEKEVRRVLRGKGIRPTAITPPGLTELDLGELLVEKGLAKPFGVQELVNFSRQLATMTNAGVPILQTLEILYKQEKNPSLRKSIKNIHSGVAGGKTLADAMQEQQGFDKLYCNLVRAGETGGILDEILEKLVEYMDKNEAIKSEIKSALTYPSIIVVVGICVIYGMMVFVVPKFAEMLEGNGQEIPQVTQIVMEISEFMQNYILYLIGGTVGAIVGFLQFKKNPQTKPVWDQIIMKAPIFGQIVIKGNLASFTRTLATMLASGVSLIDALDVCIQTIDNEVISSDLKGVRKAVTEGKTLTEPLQRIKYFPDMVAQMIKVGESTGNVDGMLIKIADVFERELREVIKTMTTMIEPLILVVLGGFVGFILIAMYMPIFVSAGGAGE
ncbi:MAG: type II secretion system F family protein [Bacteriovoracaceae bacterium]|jgi:type IV pilus assembly protein PilC|nr:type II secretion system F family protein [Bacteriovoracaceae bacterium]